MLCLTAGCLTRYNHLCDIDCTFHAKLKAMIYKLECLGSHNTRLYQETILSPSVFYEARFREVLKIKQ